MELVTAGKVGFPEVEKAFTMMTGEGGAFYNTMAKQSKSLSGQWSTFKDNIGFAARELVGINKLGDIRAGSLFDKLTKGVGKLNEVLGKVDWAKVVEDFGKSMQKTWNTISPVLSFFAKQLGGIIKQLTEFYNTNKSWLLPVIKALGVAIAVFLIAPMVVMAATITAGIFIIKAWIAIFQALTDAIRAVWQWLLNLKDTIFSFFKGAASWLVNTGKDLIGGLLAGIQFVWNNASNWLRGIPGYITGAVGNLWGILWDAGWHALNSLWEGMKNVWDKVANWLGGIGNWIKRIKGPLDKDKVMLLDEGKAIMQGFNKGIQIAYRDVEKTLAGINASVGTNINVSGSGQMPDGGGSSTTTITFSGPINLGDKTAVNEFFTRLSRNQELAQKGMATL
jgi:hypothetical protein